MKISLLEMFFFDWCPHCNTRKGGINSDQKLDHIISLKITATLLSWNPREFILSISRLEL